jgi:hypothetical protein
VIDAIRERTGEGRADITSVMTEINALLDRSIAAEGFLIAGEGRVLFFVEQKPFLLESRHFEHMACKRRTG